MLLPCAGVEQDLIVISGRGVDMWSLGALARTVVIYMASTTVCGYAAPTVAASNHVRMKSFLASKV